MRAVISEEHSSSLGHWWRERTHPRTVICLDARLDLQQINDERLRRLQACTTVEQIDALAKPHHLFPDRGYSYDLSNFLYPAARLGLIDHLVWVAPPHVLTRYKREMYEKWCQLDGVRPDELASFRKADGGWIDGRLLGLNMTICDYSQLESLTLPSDCWIDVDIDFFLLKDEPWIDPKVVFEVIRRLPSSPLLTIACSVNSGFAPVQYRFFADYLAALWEGRSDDAEHYSRLYLIEHIVRPGDRELAFKCYSSEQETYPQCPATLCLLSFCDQDFHRAQETMKRAGSLSPHYQPNISQLVSIFHNHNYAVDHNWLDALQQVARTGSLSQEMQGLIEAEIGMLKCSSGKLDRALDCYSQLTSRIGEHPELALEIAKLLCGSHQYAAAAPMLQTALEDDKSRTTARIFIAHIDLKNKRLDRARQQFELATAAAPAWTRMRKMLAHVCFDQGDVQQALALWKQVERQRREREQLATRLR